MEHNIHDPIKGTQLHEVGYLKNSSNDSRYMQQNPRPTQFSGTEDNFFPRRGDSVHHRLAESKILSRSTLPNNYVSTSVDRPAGKISFKVSYRNAGQVRKPTRLEFDGKLVMTEGQYPGQDFQKIIEDYIMDQRRQVEKGNRTLSVEKPVRKEDLNMVPLAD